MRIYTPIITSTTCSPTQQVEESRLFFAEMLRADLPARVAVASDFTFLNDRLSEHYSLPAVGGSALCRRTLPEDSPRGV